jgi:hypothetical protein
MNTKQLIVTSLLTIAGGAALASEATEFPIPPSTLTRAEVRAELARAQASGELLSSAEAEQRPFALAASTLTRAEVRAELARARASGELVSSAEAEQRPFAMAGWTRSRDEVRQEAVAFARSNTFNPLYVGG